MVKRDMKQASTRSYILARTVELLLLFIGGTISFYILRLSLLFTAANTTEYEKVSINLDSPYKKLVLAVGMLLITICLVGIRARNEEVMMNILLGVALVYVVLISRYWIEYLQMPLIGDDSGICYSVAWQMNDGDYIQFGPGGYLYNYPQQIGTVLLNLLFFKLFGQASYKPFFYFNAFFIAATVFAGTMLVRELEKRRGTRAAEILWLILSVCNVPAFLYVNYMYGEVVSYAGMVIVSWMLYEYVKTEHLRWMVGSLPFAALSVFLRKNTIIFIVAAGIVLLAIAIWKKRWMPLIFLLCLIAVVELPAAGARAYYARLSGNEVPKGIPAQLWIAMGMQDEWNGPGWYNDYNRVVFAEQNSDTDASKQVAKVYIQDRISDFKANPEMTKDFYKRKLITQWAEPSYDAMFIGIKTGSDDLKVQELVANLSVGSYTEWFWKYCNYYQALVYTGFFLYVVMKLIECIKALFTRNHGNLALRFLQEDMAEYILLITVIGGFLFSILWEAKSRYIVEYLVMMLPMAALGYAQVADRIRKVFRKD